VLAYPEGFLGAGIAISVGLDGPGSEYGQGKEVFLSPKPSTPAVVHTQFPIQWVQGFLSEE